MTLQELHDALLAWATAPPRQEELLRARRAYFDRFGEPHEDERSFESRLNGMLDHYLYDHRPGVGAHTTLDLFLREEGARYPGEILTLFRDLGRGIHGLFEVRKIRPPDSIRLRDVFAGADHEVVERRPMPGLEKRDLLEARLLPHRSRLFFSGAFLFHPREVRRAILAEVKRRKRAGDADPEAFLALLSRMAQKLERYRNVRVESLYDFRSAAAPPLRS